MGADRVCGGVYDNAKWQKRGTYRLCPSSKRNEWFHSIEFRIDIEKFETGLKYGKQVRGIVSALIEKYKFTGREEEKAVL